MFVWIFILSLWIALCSLILHDATKEDTDGSAIFLAARRIKAFTFWVILKVRELRATLSDRRLKKGSKTPVKLVTMVSATSLSSAAVSETLFSSEAISQGGRSVNQQSPALPTKEEEAPALPPKGEQAPALPPKKEQAPALPLKEEQTPALPPKEEQALILPPKEKQAPAPPPKKKKMRWWSKDGRVSMTTPQLEMAISEAVQRTAPSCQDFVGVIVQRRTPKSPLDPNWTIQGAKFGKADRKVADEALVTIVKRMQREFLLGGD